MVFPVATAESGWNYGKMAAPKIAEAEINFCKIDGCGASLSMFIYKLWLH